MLERPSYSNFRKVTQNPHFLKKAKRTPRETFKKSPKKYPSLQRAKSTLAKMSLSSNLHPLILQRLEKILAHKAALKVPQWPSYGNLGKVTQNRHFLKKCKGGTKKNFSKFPKNSPHLKGPRALWAKWHYPLISMQLKCKDWRKLWRKKKLRKVTLWQFLKRSPKTRVFYKTLKVETKENFVKMGQKIALA